MIINNIENPKQEIANLSQILRKRIAEFIENGETQKAKAEIEIYERLLKLPIWENNNPIDIRQENEKMRQDILQILEDKFKRLNVKNNINSID